LEGADETSFSYQRYNPATIALPDTTPKSAWNAKWNLTHDNEKSIDNRIDRLFVQLNIQSTTLIAGKQVIATGVGQIFTAVSQVQRYPYIYIDPEYEKTEDAVSFIWAGPLQLEARYLPKTGTQKKDNFHLRAKGSKGGFDTALTVGRSDDKAYAGLEAAGNWGSSVIRGEIVGYEANSIDWLQGLVGWDYVFSAKWSAKVEAFYNGFGSLSGYTAGPYVHRSAPFLGRWYAGALVTWETHPLFKSNLLAIVNLQDPSTLLHFFFNYSLGNNLDILFGQFINLGRADAEFAGKQTVVGPLKIGLPDVTYATVRWYF
jgi:hypothetical protein